VAAVWGYRIGIASAILANLLLNFFFVAASMAARRMIRASP
jgi:hypothetical protein